MNISMNLDHHHLIYYSLPLSLHFLMSPYYFPLSFQSSCPFIPCSHPIGPLHSQPSFAITLSILPFSFLTIFHHPIVPPLSLVIPIVIRWWSFVVWTKPPKQLLLIQNFYQDIQIKTSYKSMSHLEMSLGTSFQNMDLATLGTT